MNINIYSPYGVDLPKFISNPQVWNEFAARLQKSSNFAKDILMGTLGVDFLVELGEEYQLSPKSSAEISGIVRDVVLGYSYIGNMVVDIEKRCELPSDISTAITNELVGNLFAPILPEIKKIQKENFGYLISRQKPAPVPEELPTEPPRPVNQNNVLDLRVK